MHMKHVQSDSSCESIRMGGMGGIGGMDGMGERAECSLSMLPFLLFDRLEPPLHSLTTLCRSKSELGRVTSASVGLLDVGFATALARVRLVVGFLYLMHLTESDAHPKRKCASRRSVTLDAEGVRCTDAR